MSKDLRGAGGRIQSVLTIPFGFPLHMLEVYHCFCVKYVMTLLLAILYILEVTCLVRDRKTDVDGFKSRAESYREIFLLYEL